MGNKNKLQQFEEIKSFPNVFYMPFAKVAEGFHLKGKWHQEYFKNNNPIVLELGCGKGEYTIGLAQRFPNKNFIGMDIKGNRIWRGAKTAIEQSMNNVCFLRTRIDFIEACFASAEVSEIWITFPDPQPQKTRVRKRLTSPLFLDRYKKILVANGSIHLKTDSFPLFEYTLGVIQTFKYQLLDSTSHLYETENDKMTEARAIQTFYENKYLKEDIRICYLQFAF